MNRADFYRQFLQIDTPIERHVCLEPFMARAQACPFTVEDLVRWGILTTLWALNGNRKHTARSLGLSIRTIRIRINKYLEFGFYVPAPGCRSPGYGFRPRTFPGHLAPVRRIDGGIKPRQRQMADLPAPARKAASR